MKSVYFSDAYLSEVELVAPVTHKLVYMFVLIFRRCTLTMISDGLNMERKTVSGAIESLLENGLIVRDGCKERFRLPGPADVLPLERQADSGDKPDWYYG